MISDAHGRELLKEISEKRRITNDDIMVLGAIIQQMFPDNSTIRNTFNKLESENAGFVPGMTSAPPPHQELQRLARSAGRLIEPSQTPDRSDPKTFADNVALMVDRSFYESQLFRFAKWILIVGLVLVGAGTLSYTGFSVTFMSQANEAKQKLQDITDKYDGIKREIDQKGKDLAKLQEQTIEDVKNAIKDNAAKWDSQFSAFIEDLKKKSDATARAAESFVEDQKNNVIKSVAGNDAFIEDQKKKLVASVAAANTVIDGHKSTVSGYVAVANDHLEAEKRNFGSSLNASYASLEEQKKKFAAQLAELLKQANDQVDPALKGGLGVVAKAAENGAQKIEEESKRRLEALGKKAEAETDGIHEAAERKKAELGFASDKNIRAVDAALNGKLSELNQRSLDAGLALDTVAGTLKARESGFVSAMNSRLDEWDKRIALEFKRVEDLARTSGELDAKTKEIDTQLSSLLPNFKPALQVAEELKSGTSSGELPFIGKVLEKSALLFMIGMTAAVLSLVLLLIGIFGSGSRYRSTENPAPP